MRPIKERLRRLVAERRGARRYRAELGVRLVAAILFEGVSPVEPVVGRTRDLSATGLMLSFPAGSLRRRGGEVAGAPARVVLLLPARAVSMGVTVKRVEPPGAGGDAAELIAVEITGMSPDERAAYAEYLDTLA